MPSFTKMLLLFLLFSCDKPAAIPVVVAGGPHQTAHLPFDWEVYSDPSRPEFWADGADGILPRPFLHLAGEPTKENAQKLADWQKLQWKVIGEVIRALGGAKEIDMYDQILGGNFLSEVSKLENAQLLGDKAPKSDSIWSDLSIVYIYRSSCEVCQKQKSLIHSLESLGVKIVPLQLDFGIEKALVDGSMEYSSGDWASYFPLDHNQTTPTFYLVRKGDPPIKHVGFLILAQLTEILNS